MLCLDKMRNVALDTNDQLAAYSFRAISEHELTRNNLLIFFCLPWLTVHQFLFVQSNSLYMYMYALS